MCYTRSKDERDLEREARRITESRLMEEDARRRAQDKKPLTEKVKEMVGTTR